MSSTLLLLILAGLIAAARTFVPDGGESVAAGADLAFGYVLLSALFAGRLSASLRTPKVTGYLLVGLIAGPHALALLSTEMVERLGLVNGVAVCLIALTAGGELSLSRLRPLIRSIGWMTAATVLVATLSLAGTLLLMRPMLPWLAEIGIAQAVAMAVLLAVILASQSPAVVMALLAELRADGPVSRTALGIVVVADLVVIVLYAFASSALDASLGGEVSPLSALGVVAWELFGSMAVGAVIGGILWVYIAKIGRSVGLFVLLLFVLVAELGVRAHLDPLIVALTAGFFVENVSTVDASDLIHDTERTSLPVYLVFFAVAGATVDIASVQLVFVPAIILILVRAGAFWWGSRLAGRMTGADPMVVRWAWTGTLPQAGLALALVVLMERNFGELGAKAVPLVLGVVAINQLITPLLLRMGLLRAGEAEARPLEDFSAQELVVEVEELREHEIIP